MARHLLPAAILLLTLAGGFTAVATTQDAQDFAGLPVVEITFSPPAQPIPEARLSKLVAQNVGAPLDTEQVRQSIYAMFATGRYADIQVDAARSGDGVKLTFITADNWFIGPVRVLDVQEPPSADQLVHATRLTLGELYTDQRRDAAVSALQSLLADNGYHRAVIDVDKQAHSDTQQIDITFHVKTGPRARFGEIRLTGKPDLTADRVRSVTGWRRDRRFAHPAVHRGLEKLRGHYLNREHLQAAVRVVKQDYAPASNRIDLEVEVTPGPVVEVAISGADLSKKQLRRYIPIYEEGAVDRDLLAEGARNLTDYFQAKGYFETKVDYDQHPEENGRILVEFQATRGERHEFVKLEITGNRYFDLATIRERMYLQPGDPGRYSQGLLRADIQAIEELYRSNGFQEIQVRKEVQDDYQGKKGNVAVSLQIEEGPQTLVSRLTIQGNQTMPTDSFRDRLSALEGQPFSEFNVAHDRDQILAQYFTEGFPDATFEWRYSTAAEPHRVELEYTIQEGERQFVSQVIVEGQENTDETLIRRQIHISPSDPLSQTEMLESQRRLYNFGIFSKVEMAVQNPEGNEDFRNLLVQLQEARKWTIGVGGGAEVGRIGGGRTNFRAPAGETGFSPRFSLEVNRLNMFGHAGTLSFRSRVSTLQQRGLITYQVPQWRGRERLTLTFSSLFERSLNIRTFTATRLEGALQLQHQISKPSTLFYRYSYRRVQATKLQISENLINPELTGLLSQPVRVGLLSGTFAQDRRDDPLDAKRGIYNTVDLGIAGGFLGSEAGFFRLLTQNSTYHPITKRILLARTTQLGGMFPLSGRSEEIPLPERFFSGGSNSHRGFPVNQAGPRDLLTGFPLGGNSLLLNSVELRFPVRGNNIGGVLFHDAGNVFAKTGTSFRMRQRNDQDFDYMVHAVGLGLRYRTPIGPIRLDFAYSINPPRFRGFEGTRGELIECLRKGTCASVPQRISRFQFHFSLGQTF